ncbi:protein sll1483-like [Liolophura sinensis]|uniref:protein sll1483-like n=1 Tax=Liolophura sinensis TaxID=3198878 RepID=UPI003158543A
MKELLLVAALVLGAQAGNLVEELQKLNVSTLIQLATTAGLADTLTNGGPFTLLAPTDAAFGKLPEATLSSLQSDKAALTDVLKYHLIQGDIFSWDLLSGDRFTTLNGRRVKVTTSGTTTMFNGAKVLVHDNVASNGVIYLIDTVLTVPEASIFQAISNRPELSTFVDALTRARLDTSLNATNIRYPYTVFAPTNTAFSKLTTEQLNHILESRYLLLELVDYHIHLGQLHKGSLTHNGRITTRYSGHYITVTITDGEPILNHVAHLSEADIEAENGLVHVIDHLLLPSSLASIIG